MMSFYLMMSLAIIVEIFCDEYAILDSRFYVIHKENGGLCDARNVGIDYSILFSDCKRITFIDSDDWIHHHYLELLYDAANKSGSQISICGYLETSDKSISEKSDTRLELVRIKMQRFAESQIVITDRLHGMVFAALTGTPCMVFANNHHKVMGTYDWISYLPYIKYASDVEDAIKIIPQLLKMNNCLSYFLFCFTFKCICIWKSLFSLSRYYWLSAGEYLFQF